MEQSSDQSFEEFMMDQKRQAIKKTIFWLCVVAGVTFLVMFGIFSFFDAITASIVSML